MKLIDIRTTQNVTITYELASLRDRLLAFLLDFMIYGIAFLLLVWVFALLSIVSVMGEVFIWILALPVPIFYSLCMEVLNNGQSVGKMALRIKVVKLDGKQLTFFDYLLRWCFRFIDIWFTGGTMAAILSSSTDHGQRLGGLVSNSTVVRLNPTLYVSLNDILKINTTDNYEPKYPAIRNFRESDMLLIKQTLDRYAKFRNDAHRSAINELTSVVAERLNLNGSPNDEVHFLKTVIKDYIVLTR